MPLDSFRTNSVEDWTTAAAVALGVVIALLLVRLVLVRFTERGPQSGAATLLRGLASASVRRTHAIVILIVALFAGSIAVTLPGEVARVVHSVTVIALLVQVGLWGSTTMTFAARWHREHTADFAAPGVREAGQYIGKLALWSLLLAFALNSLGVQATALIASLGIGGIAIALATQNILGDLFASLAMVFDRPFIVGDFIVADDMSGRVEQIGVKTTRLRSINGEQIVIGNSDLLGSRIRNYGRMCERRVLVTLGVTYDTAVEKVEAIPGIMRVAVEQQASARFERAHFRGYGESALEFEAVYHIKNADYDLYMDTQQAVNLDLLRRFREASIELALPAQTVHVHGQASPRAD